MNEIDVKILQKIKNNKGVKFAIYPFGAFGRCLYNLLVDNGIDVDVIVDNSPHKNYPCISEINAPENYYWLIAINNVEKYVEIKNTLIGRKVPFEKIIDICKNEEKILDVVSDVQNRYKSIEKVIKSRASKRITALVVYKQTFGLEKLFKQLICDKNWTVRIVVVPLSDKTNRESVYNETRKHFCQVFGDEFVVDGYDFNNNCCVMLQFDYEYVYCSNPYDSIIESPFSIMELSKKNVLPLYVSYGYDIGYYTSAARFKGWELNLVWKYFIDTEFSYKDCCKYQYLKGSNAKLIGYAKMDSYARCSHKKKRKKFLICSHHTIMPGELALSNFLKYNEFIVKLPDIFPECDFVFRPHPLLFSRLIQNGLWSEAVVNAYKEKLEKQGIYLSEEGNYFDLFNECDAIINDCGSFTVEWLYTNKPGCFMKNEKLLDNEINNLMKYCLKGFFIANTEEDIIGFIRRVCANIEESRANINEKDFIEKIAIGYPNVSESIYKALV